MNALTLERLWECAGIDLERFRLQFESAFSPEDFRDPRFAQELADIRYFLRQSSTPEDISRLIQGRLALLRNIARP